MIIEMASAAVLAVMADGPNWRDPPECWEGPQSELTHCAWMEYRQADHEMNEQWERTVAVVKRIDREWSPDPDYGETSQFDSLLAAQRAWLEFRENHCARYSSAKGSMTPMLRGICFRDLTIQRTGQLYQLTRSDVRDEPIFPDMGEKPE